MRRTVCQNDIAPSKNVWEVRPARAGYSETLKTAGSPPVPVAVTSPQSCSPGVVLSPCASIDSDRTVPKLPVLFERPTRDLGLPLFRPWYTSLEPVSFLTTRPLASVQGVPSLGLLARDGGSLCFGMRAAGDSAPLGQHMRNTLAQHGPGRRTSQVRSLTGQQIFGSWPSSC